MKGIKNYVTEGQATASTANFCMTDEQVMKEILIHKDRVAVAVYRSETATVIVSQLYPLEDLELGTRKEYGSILNNEPSMERKRSKGQPSGVVTEPDGWWPEG